MGLWQGGSKHIIKCKSLPGRRRALPPASILQHSRSAAFSSGFSPGTRQAALLTADFTVQHRRTLQCKPTPHHDRPERASVLLSQKATAASRRGGFRFDKASQEGLTSDTCPSLLKCIIQDTMFPSIQTAQEGEDSGG